MRILGIESSCDETAAAVIETGYKLVSNVVHSQVARHQPFGGVVPEIASREHLTKIGLVVDKALEEAGGIDTIDAIAVTTGPGLVGGMTQQKIPSVIQLSVVWNVLRARIQDLQISRSNVMCPLGRHM